MARVCRLRVLLAATVAAATVAAAVAPRTSAQAPGALPLANLGLEHLDIVVPDPAASARFYARFRTALHQQPIRGG
jgi:hypothetical protein